MLKTVLIALDDSDAADQVVQTLQQIQLEPDAELILAHVMFSDSEPIDIASDRPTAEVENLGDLYAERLNTYRATLPWKSTVEVVWGDPADEIVRLAYLHKADLIVVGNRGLTGVNRVLKGSVSSEVVAEAPCSVLVVKPSRIE